jgi:hypothetical protein
MDFTGLIAAGSAVVASFIFPIRWLHGGAKVMKQDMANLERRAVGKDDMERMITLYTDPIKADVRATKRGVDALIEKFHSLELFIARELGGKSNKDETK